MNYRRLPLLPVFINLLYDFIMAKYCNYVLKYIHLTSQLNNRLGQNSTTVVDDPESSG